MSDIGNIRRSHKEPVVFCFKLLIILATIISGAECRRIKSPSSVQSAETLTSSENGTVTYNNSGSAPKLSQRTEQDVARSMDFFGSGNVSHLANKIFKLGERGSGTRPLSNVQDFHQLKKELLANNKLFEDPEFPAQHSSIFGAKHVEKDIEWVRPPGIVPNPKLFINGSSRFEVNQGRIGDCWLLVTFANLAMDPKLFFQVVPKDQSFEREHYAGIFHFRFWQYGRWVDVVIDDRLPMHEKKLYGLPAADQNIFWSALLEKAFAKLQGSYEALNGGFEGDGQEDFTGGITMTYGRNGKNTSDLFDILLKAEEKKSLISCGMNKYEGRYKDDKTLTKEEKMQGLVDGHAYSITKVKHFHDKTNNSVTIPLVRVRNPWGTGEWTGAWNDDSSKWNSISDHEKEAIGFKSAEDGEFWMPIEEVIDYFSDIQIGYLNINSMIDNDKMSSDKIEWETSAFEGEWVRGATAGGPSTNLKKFQYNPQYRITLEENSTVILALMQKNLRIQRGKRVFHAIRFSIYPLPEIGSDPTEKLPKPLDLDFFRNSENTELDFALIPETIADAREVSARVPLQPGAYIIIPYISDSKHSDIESEFLLRVYSEHPNNLEEYTEPMSIHDDKEVLGDREIETLREFFRLLAGDDWELDWIELKKFMDYEMFNGEDHKEGFSKYMSRSVIAMLDLGRSGNVGFEEFKTFWRDFEKLKEVFHRIKNERVDEVSEDLGQDAVDDVTVKNDNEDAVDEVTVKDDGVDAVDDVTVKDDGVDAVDDDTVENDNEDAVDDDTVEDDGVDVVDDVTVKDDGVDAVDDDTVENDNEDAVDDDTVEDDGVDVVDDVTVKDDGKVAVDDVTVKDDGEDVVDDDTVKDDDDDVADDGDYLSTFHLRRALHEAGIDVNNHVLGRMVRRFGSEKKMIKFEDFVMCAMRLKKSLRMFEKTETPLNWQEWRDDSLYF